MSDRPPSTPSALPAWILKIWHSWATRSLAVGGIATVLDVCTLLVCVKLLRFPNPIGAMVGVTVGSTFTFFANRHFAFRDHHPDLAPQALKFSLATLGAMVIHGSLVWLLADKWGLQVVLAKLAADVAVFSVGQLLVLRYVVFPKKKVPHPAEGEEGAGPNGSANGNGTVNPSTSGPSEPRPTASPAFRRRSDTPASSRSRSQPE